MSGPENRKMADHRLPIYLSLPLPHYAVMIEPMLSKVNLRSYFTAFRSEDGKCLIQNVSVGGESGPNARICDYAWILDVHMQCVEYGVPFHFHQTGARLRRGGKIYNIAREQQHTQAYKAGLDYNGI